MPTPRHLTPMPAERIAALPWVTDPLSGTLGTPYTRRTRGLTLTEEEQVDAMLDRVAMLRQAGRLSPEPCWVWPDRDPEPIRNDNPSWLKCWRRDRAAFQVIR